MRIGVLASIAHRTPPVDYGPWEQVASTLAEGLVGRGHEVTLFATADSVTSARLSAVAPTGYETGGDYDVKALECLHVANAFQQCGDLDVLSNQFDFLPLSYSRLVDTPVVTTVHGFSSPRILPVYRAYDDVASYVAISHADRHPDLHYTATIHHGLDLRRFTFRSEPGDYLLFLGRLHPDKGAHRAIEVARRTGLPLRIAGTVQDADYVEARIRPHLGDGVEYLGPVGPDERDGLLGGALALLHLVSFDEPFGLSVIEALATGTPVVATARGALPETVLDGRTGVLLPDGPDGEVIDTACDAVGRVASISRHRCREDVAHRFTAERMVEQYEALFRAVVTGGSA